MQVNICLDRTGASAANACNEQHDGRGVQNRYGSTTANDDDAAGTMASVAIRNEAAGMENAKLVLTTSPSAGSRRMEQRVSYGKWFYIG